MKWRPVWHPSALQIRSAALRAIREFFRDRGYLEVTTPVLSRDVVVDAHLNPLSVSDPDGQGTLYFQTSPEAAMKRLLAAKSGSIYQIGPVFRAGEQGDRHNPEFTMVEWYGVGTTDDDQMQLTEQLVVAVQQSVADCCQEIEPPPWKPLPSWTNPFGQVSYRQAFQNALGIDVLGIPLEELRFVCQQLCGLQLPPNIDRDDILNVLLAEKLEPSLGASIPEFLHGYPISQAALAVADDRNPETARRFELYIHGLEICNGYYELTDADELKRRTDAENQRRVAASSTTLPGAPRLEAAMKSGLPECSGVAMGFERLLMALLGTPKISDVLPFPWDVA